MDFLNNVTETLGKCAGRGTENRLVYLFVAVSKLYF